MKQKKRGSIWRGFWLLVLFVLVVLACAGTGGELSANDGGEIKIIKMEPDSSLGYVNIAGQAVDKAGKPFYKGGGPDGYRHNKAYIYQSNNDQEPLVLDGKWQKTESQTELTYTTEVLIPKNWENVSLVYTLYATSGDLYIYCNDVLIYSEAPCRPWFVTLCMRTPLPNIKFGEVNRLKVRIIKGPEWNGILVTSLIPSSNIVGDFNLKECKFNLVYPIDPEGGKYLLTYFQNEEVQVFKPLGEVKEIFGGKVPAIAKIKTELPQKNFPGLNLPQTIYFTIGYGPFALQFDPTVLLSPLALSLGLNIFPSFGGNIIWSPEGEIKLSETGKNLIQRLNDLGVALFYGCGAPGLPYEKELRDKIIHLVTGEEEEVEILDQNGKSKIWGVIPFSNYNAKAINLRKFLLRKVVGLYSKEVKYFIFNTYNEPSYGSGSGEKMRIIDYSEPSIREFRNWLKEKHRSLGRLNKTWGSKYKSWEEVEPLRVLFPREQPQKAAWYDWTVFRTEEFSKFFEREYRLIKSIDPKIPVVTRYPSSIYISGCGYTRTIGAHDWALLYDKTTDFGQMHFHPEMMFGEGDYCFEIDAVRGLSNKEYLWSEEWYADFAHVGGPAVSGKIKGQIVTRNLWLAIARNVVGFCNWYGYQFLSPFNKDVANQFRKEVGKIRKIEPYLFDSEIEEAPIAILDPFTPSIQIDNGHGFEASVEGYHHALAYNRLYPLGFISERYLNELDNYKILYIPYSPYMRKDVCNEIKRWVKKGGTIVADGPIGVYDEYGYPQEGGLLAELFGASVDLKSDLGWGRGEVQLEKSLGGFSKGTNFIWHFDSESPFKEYALLPHTAEVIATYKDKPIITKGKYGKGIAYLCGLPLGFRAHNRSARDPGEPRKTWDKIIASFALDVGIEPKIKVTNPELDLIPRKGRDGKLYLFITNWDPMRTQEGVIEVTGRYKEVRELIAEEEIPFEPSGKGIKFEVEVLPGKAKVLRIF